MPVGRVNKQAGAISPMNISISALFFERGQPPGSDEPLPIMGVSMIPGQIDRTLHTRIIKRRIQLSEGGDSLVHHRGDLLVVGNIAVDGECFVAGGN